jgi:hypothetical protein
MLVIVRTHNLLTAGIGTPALQKRQFNSIS